MSAARIRLTRYSLTLSNLKQSLLHMYLVFNNLGIVQIHRTTFPYQSLRIWWSFKHKQVHINIYF